jgi:hypothetical protein
LRGRETASEALDRIEKFSREILFPPRLKLRHLLWQTLGRASTSAPIATMRRPKESGLRRVERMWWRADGDNRDGKQPPVASKSVSVATETLFAATTLRTPRVARYGRSAGRASR